MFDNFIENELKEWTENLPEEEKELLLKMTKEDVYSSFYQNLHFGTAGVRGQFGIGPNRINNQTISKITRAYVEFLNTNKNNLNKKIIIGHDNRHNGKEYCVLIANILKSSGYIPVLNKNNELASTPYLSFAVKNTKNTIGGIVITASHNGKEWSGYKIFDHLGIQLLSEDSLKISEHFQDIKWDWNPEYHNSSFEEISQDIFEKYITHCLDQNKVSSPTLKISLSPIGATICNIGETVFKKLGYETHVTYLENTVDPDFLNFPENANPELIKVFKNNIRNAENYGCDIALQPDPDGDRIGICYKTAKGFQMISTNKIAIIIYYYLSEIEKSKKNTVITNFVSTNYFLKINQNLNYISTPVGIRWIADEAKNISPENLCFGYEESCGFIINNELLEKDFIFAGAYFCKILNHFKEQGKNIENILQEIFEKYGFFIDERYYFSGEKSLTFLENLDFWNKIAKENKMFLETDFYSLDKSFKENMIKLSIDKFNWIIIRNSGTEPKSKIYTSVIQDKMLAAKNINKKFIKIIQVVKKNFNFMEA